MSNKFYRTCPCGATHTGGDGSIEFAREHNAEHAERVVKMQNPVPSYIPYNPYGNGTYPSIGTPYLNQPYIISCSTLAGGHTINNSFVGPGGGQG